MLKRIFLASLLVLSTSLATASAGALPSSGSSSSGDSDCAKARQAGRTCSLVFDGDTVSGDRAAGEGEQIAVADSVTFSNLITVRTSFRDLIVKTADDI